MNPVTAFLCKHKNRLIDILVICLVGVISLTWFRGNNLVSQTEFQFPANPFTTFTNCLFSWDNSALGNANARILAGTIPHESLRVFLMGFLNLPVTTAEQIWVYLIFTLSGVSMYYLMFVLFGNGRGSRLAGLFSSLFYMMNPFTLTFFWREIAVSNYIYVFLPFHLALFIKGLNEKRGVFFAFVLALLITVTATSGFINPVYLLIEGFVLASYLLFHILYKRSKQDILGALKFTFFAAIFFLLINSFWIIPSVALINRSFGFAQDMVINTSTIGMWQLNSANSIFSAMRMTGFWGLGQGFQGDLYMPWSPVYFSPLFVAISFLLPILAFVSIAIKLKGKYVLFFTLVAVFGLFLVKGPYPPLGELTTWVYTHTPLLTIFKSTYKHLGVLVAFSYAFLIGVGVSSLYLVIENVRSKHSGHRFAKIRKVLSKSFVGLMFFLILGLYAWPFWTGAVIYSAGNVIPSSRFQIPSYYTQASDWVGSQAGDFRILSLPLPKQDIVVYNWTSGYIGADPIVFPKNLISTGFGFAGVVADLIVSNQTSDVGKLLNLINAKYIMFHRDADWQYLSDDSPWYYTTSFQDFQSIFSSQKDLTLVKSFGEVDFYENTLWQPLQLYTVNNAILVNGSTDKLLDVICDNSFDSAKSIVGFSDQLSAQQIRSIPFNATGMQQSSNRTSMAYKEIDRTKYEVTVNTSSAFYLVLSESYDSGWVATVNGQAIPDQNHFTANGYANAWFLNKTGNYTITLEFTPQNLFYVGVAISITSLVVFTSSILYIKRDRIKRLSFVLRKR